MYATKCSCGQTILVRNVRLDEERVFFLSMSGGALHARTVCPCCGKKLLADDLKPKKSPIAELSFRSLPARAIPRLRPWRLA